MSNSNPENITIKPFENRSLPVVALAAIGIVFGDIGTSPLYTMSTIFDPTNGLPLTSSNLVGVVSLILWSLIIIVSVKYVTLIMRANNNGEGGIMALLALAASSVSDRPRLRYALLSVGVFGAALFFGDGIITPAISVLSAVEGLEVAAPQLKTFVIPITLTVLIALFLMQKKGTTGIGAVFGPIMVIWFFTLALIGLFNIFKAPAILAALNPLEGIKFLSQYGWIAFVSLGSVVLALTGAEALYADMGHFGVTPIRLSWFGLVFPALGLNYLGQGALLMIEPASVDRPFFHLFPSWALYPVVLLATVATVIASQAVISGAFSMSKQAIQLGFLPRMNVIHTSELEIGQIYVPAINWLLLIAVVLVVLGFGSSSALGSAYGIAVTGTMLITTFLTFFVVRYTWKLSWTVSILATTFFLIIDTAFFAANLLKFIQGGWFPLLAGAVIYLTMSTWSRGRNMVLKEARERANAAPLQQYLKDIFNNPPARVPGTAVFLTIDPDAVPQALLNNVEHNHVLHERIIFVSVVNLEIPFSSTSERLNIMTLGNNCFRLIVKYGFKDDVNVPLALTSCEAKGLTIDALKTSYFLSDVLVVAVTGKDMSLWRKKFFVGMSHNIGSVAAYLKLPSQRIVELGSRIEI